MNKETANVRLTMEELEALEWYDNHNKAMTSLGLDPDDTYSFTKLEKAKWGNGENKCVKCTNVLIVGQKKYCTQCSKRYNDFTEMGLVYGG
jgi:hypothetical protein